MNNSEVSHVDGRPQTKSIWEQSDEDTRGHKRHAETAKCKKLHSAELHDMYSSPHIVGLSNQGKWDGHSMLHARQPRRPMQWSKDNIKMVLNYSGRIWTRFMWLNYWRTSMKTDIILQVLQNVEIFMISW